MVSCIRDFIQMFCFYGSSVYSQHEFLIGQASSFSVPEETNWPRSTPKLIVTQIIVLSSVTKLLLLLKLTDKIEGTGTWNIER